MKISDKLKQIIFKIGMVLKISFILHILTLFVIYILYTQQIVDMFESDKDRILPVLAIFGTVFIITFILYSVIRVKISEKMKDILIRIIDAVTTSIIAQLFIYIAFPWVFGDSFENNIIEYMTHIFVFFITGILIYSSVLLVRKFKIFSILLPCLNICLGFISINFTSDNFYLGYFLINSALIYSTTIMMLKYRMAFILPFIYFIHFVIFRINYLWAEDQWFIDVFYKDGAKLLLCYAVSFIPYLIITRFNDEKKEMESV